MTCIRGALRCAIGMLLGLILSGCFPSGDNQLDEQKEPYFLAGKSHVSSMNFPAAVDSFEKALQVNPQNASAHFELAWISDDKMEDPSSAIYHYERFLKLRPSSDRTDLVKQRINSCKQRIAATVSVIGQWSPERQRDLDKLMAENKTLKERVAQWEAYYASHPPQTNTAQAQASSGAQPSNAGAATAAQISSPGLRNTDVTDTRSMQTNIARPIIPTPAARRTHVVKAGDTPASIARQYRVSLNALQSANPQLQPTRMRIGQVVNIPSN